jgi:TPR repeat protein
MNIDTLMAAPLNRDTGEALLLWVNELRGRVLSGDMMIGILSTEEVGKVPQALKRAIACGEPKAWIVLADWFLKPAHGSSNIPAAIETLRSAIATGNHYAALRLAEVQWHYRRGDATAAEQAEAYAIAKKSAASDANKSAALYLLGLFTFQGFGVHTDPAHAASLQTEAAALGNADAMFEAFIYYETGQGVQKDSARAFTYLESSAEAGNARAMYNLGAYHATGKTVPKNPAVAAEWYRKAGDAGNPKALAMLGVMYAKGEGVRQDLEYAAQLFDEAEYVGFDTSSMREAVGL